MTDYYALGGGRKIDGPYSLDDARERAVQMANEDGYGKVLALHETVQGVLDDDVKERFKKYE